MSNANSRQAAGSTRNQIIALLSGCGEMTVKALAGELSITKAGVHRHLAMLERDGLVQVTLLRQKMGRPTFSYALTEHAHDLFPTDYAQFATQLLAAVHSTQGERGINALFAARRRELLELYRPRMTHKDLTGRVRELAGIQEQAGYMAEWSRTRGGFVLTQHNCAIYRVACRFQQACHFETELFGRLLDAAVTREQHQIQGDRSCTFKIRKTP